MKYEQTIVIVNVRKDDGVIKTGLRHVGNHDKKKVKSTQEKLFFAIVIESLRI